MRTNHISHKKRFFTPDKVKVLVRKHVKLVQWEFEEDSLPDSFKVSGIDVLFLDYSVSVENYSWMRKLDQNECRADCSLLS